MAQKKKEEERLALEQKKAQQPTATINYAGQQATIQSKNLPNPSTKPPERPARNAETPQKPPRGASKPQPVSTESDQFNGTFFFSLTLC